MKITRIECPENNESAHKCKTMNQGQILLLTNDRNSVESITKTNTSVRVALI